MEQFPRDDIEKILTNEIGIGAEIVSRGRLVTAGTLESFDLMRLVTLLEDRFAIEITPSLITPSNFDSVDSMATLIEDLRDGRGGQPTPGQKMPYGKVGE